MNAKQPWLLIPLLGLILCSCEYERMTNQESIRPYEQKMPAGVRGAVPIHTGEARYRLAPAGSLGNPIPSSSKSIAKGAQNYVYFCIQCHGSKYDGDGKVGQSFCPLPTDLMSVDVQEMTDDQMFRLISYGGDKSPPLAYTISDEDRWHILNWIRSLGVRTSDSTPASSGDFPKPGP